MRIRTYLNFTEQWKFYGYHKISGALVFNSTKDHHINTGGLKSLEIIDFLFL